MATTFHLFPRLPAEIRLLIWEFTIEPKVLEFSPGTINDRSSSFIKSFRTPPPKGALVCHEAREHLEKVYHKVNFGEDGNDTPTLWFNPHVDKIFTAHELLQHLVQRPDAALIQTLIIDFPSQTAGTFWLPYLRILDSTLKTVILDSIGWTLSDNYSDTNLDPCQEMLDEEWMEDVFDIHAQLYWRCKPAPFHTLASKSDATHLGEINKKNYVERIRLWSYEEARKNPYIDFSTAEEVDEYTNDAGSYWDWSHDDCECEDKEQNLGQLLLDKCIEEHPIDVADLMKNWKR